MRKRLIVLAVLLLTARLQAAEAVRWDDLPRKLHLEKPGASACRGLQYRVIASDGSTVAGCRIAFSAVDVEVLGAPPVPRAQVREIRVGRAYSFQEVVFAPVYIVPGLICGDHLGCFILATPVGAALAAGFAPVAVVVEGARRAAAKRAYRVLP